MALRSLAIDPVTGGFVMSNGSPSFVDGKDAKAQQVRILFKTVQGEYFLDSSLGIPYLDGILVKNPNILYIQAIYANSLKSLGLVQINVVGNYNKANRELTIFWQAFDQEDNPLQGTI